MAADREGRGGGSIRDDAWSIRRRVDETIVPFQCRPFGELISSYAKYIDYFNYFLSVLEKIFLILTQENRIFLTWNGNFEGGNCKISEFKRKEYVHV